MNKCLRKVWFNKSDFAGFFVGVVFSVGMTSAMAATPTCETVQIKSESSNAVAPILLPSSKSITTCLQNNFTYQSVDYEAVAINPSLVQLHWKNSQDQAFTRLSAVKAHLESNQRAVLALMNAGIYSGNHTPAGLHVENGQVFKSLNSRKGKGNFHLMPNGVFLIDKQNRVDVVTTQAFEKYYEPSALKLATQSGPMLLIEGKLNQAFIENSQSLYTRNAVCKTKAGVLYFAASQAPVNFFDFANALLKLGCHNALYLDGNISKLFIQGENTTFHFYPFVGILSVTVKAKELDSDD